MYQHAMMPILGYKRILDNQSATLADYLRRRLLDSRDFDFVSAYFSIYGYELMEDALQGVEQVRFLFGDPASVDDMDPGSREPKSFELGESGLKPNHSLQQKYVAKRCAEWFSRESLAVRSVSRSNFLHGKLYLAGAAGVVGSSNFTRRGLGGSDQANLEINLAVTDQDTLTELREWFERLWNDEQRTEDVKERVLEALARIGRDYAPEAVYFKTLYELFRKDIEARMAGDDAIDATGFTSSRIWNALYEFQKDGARGVIAKLRQHHGCILADSVGLGKTYTALAVIKYLELRNERVLVLCPRKLYENWSLYPASNNHRQNPFLEDRFGYTLLAHTDLSRDSGMSGGVNLETFNWGNYDLVVIDESHNFRNDGGQRYKRLLEETVRGGTKTKVLMLSATPVNTSLVDLRNQIYLMTEGREDAFRASLGVGSIRSLMREAQKQFEEWETAQRGQPKRDKARLLESLGADFLRLLDGVSISRSRRQVEQFYAAELDRVGRFPNHARPDNHHPPTDVEGKLSYKELADRIEGFTLSVYQPSFYLTDRRRLDELEKERKEYNFDQRDRERFLVHMMRTNFLKRLESSAHALTLTLRRTVGKIDALLERIDRYENSKLAADDLGAADVMPDDDEEDDDFFVNRRARSYHLSELDLTHWRKDLKQDRETLGAAWRQVEAITPERDGKLQEIRRAVRARVEKPTLDRDGNPNRKLLVFTTFKDTAKYLYEQLSGLAGELGVNMAMVSGDETHAGFGANDFNSILTNFAPVARNRNAADAGADIDLLIATDCISEGQNLQDCDTVLNYDIHWNPVRLIQRFGRIDRIGSRSSSVRMMNYWPTEKMEEYLRLKTRVQARMALVDVAASGDDDPFSEDDAQLELNFRDQQLRRLLEEIPSLEDLDDSPSMSDFTLDYFITQLLRYLESNKEELEAMPLGVYAVAEDAPSGVMFFLRQHNAGAADARRRVASPVHPFYLVHVQDDGSIRYGCANARQTLDAFEAATQGKTDPIRELCDRFDRETEQGRNMSRYDGLLKKAATHVMQAHDSAQLTGIGISGHREFRLVPASKSPRGVEDFELVTWLVVMGKE